MFKILDSPYNIYTLSSKQGKRTEKVNNLEFYFVLMSHQIL